MDRLRHTVARTRALLHHLKVMYYRAYSGLDVDVEMLQLFKGEFRW